jgi:AhpD family alkylhydroperoxidase
MEITNCSVVAVVVPNGGAVLDYGAFRADVLFHSNERKIQMGRDEIYQQIEEMFGVVPVMFKVMPDSSLEMEWELFKRVQFDEGAIPNKYRELIGLAIASVTKCRYCLFYHTELAKLNGATPEEIEDAVHFAKSSAGWSAYISGLQLDFDTFKSEVLQACEHVRAQQAGKS